MNECVVWKLILTLSGEAIEYWLPQGAQFLHVREQREAPCIWYRCDPNAPKEKRIIQIVSTGSPAPATGHYLGTFFLQYGDLVFHVFELGETK